MAYQVLARKWRPQNFSSLVGQEPIVTALRNALAEGRIAHAYLFSGIRGVGKTTAARVLAKALNCERGPAPDPCDQCTACIEIARGSDLDVLEVDAATYSKVEQVRELTESLRYGPARDRYKVVVLDEVHRLSRQAFDALLKIVEEPPPYLVFIFATTEIEAVPATILSRCQEFQFRRVPAPAVAALLRQICGSESIQASDSALRLVARAGEGSVRDAVALLDQLATFGSGTISDEAAIRLLGGLDIALFRRLLEAILAGDAPAVSREVKHIEDEGWDPRHVYGQFLAYCRDALHLALGGDPSQVDLALEEAQGLAGLSRACGYENLLRLLNHLLTSEPIVRRTETGALAIEIAWLRAAELPKLIRIEQFLAGGPAAATALGGRQAPADAAGRPAAGTGTAARGAASSPSSQAGPVTPAAPARPPSAPAPAPAAAVPAAPGGAGATSGAGADNAGADAAIRAFLEEVAARKQPLAAHLEQAAALRFEDGRLLILVSPGDAYLSSRLRQPGNRETIAAAAVKVWGPGTAWDFAESASLRPAASPAAKASRGGAAAVADENGEPATEAAPRSRQAGSAATGDERSRGRLATAGAAADWRQPEPRPLGAPSPDPSSDAELNPAVQTLLDIFGGKIEAVEEHRGSREE